MTKPLEEAEELARNFVHKVGNDLGWLFKAGDTKATDGQIVTDFTASTSDVDRMDDVIDQKTWRIANFRRNPVILHEHAAPVVGRSIKTSVPKDTGALGIRVLWDDSPANPTGQLVAHQHANGFRSAGSVGFRPGKIVSRTELAEGDPLRVANVSRWETGSVFSYCELLEFSSVAIPANPAALQLQSYLQEFEDDRDEQIRRAVTETVSRELAASVLHAIRHDEQIRRAISAMVLTQTQPKPETKANTLDHLFK